MTTIGLVTSRECVSRDREMSVFARRCNELSIQHRVIEWDGDPDLNGLDLLLIRSVWNYFHHLEAFLSWLRHVRRTIRIPVINDERIVRWNCHKRYLIELEEQGFPVVPLWIGTDSKEAANQFVGANRRALVVKPAVGAGGNACTLVNNGSLEGFQNAFSLAQEAWPEVIVQPFFPSVRDPGERALIVIGDSIVAALQKTPAADDWRVHREFGGRVSPTSVDPLDRQLVTRLFDYVQRRTECMPRYGRVDLLEGSDGIRRILEVELIDPVLYADQWPRIAANLVDVCML